MPRYAKAVRDRALQLYAQGNSAGEVAVALGLKRFTVKQWLRARGETRSMSAAAALSVAKRPRGHRGRKVHWLSPKADGVQIADSLYEAARMRQLDNDDRVASWARCRDRVVYVAANGKTRIYVPDLAITLRAGRKVVEEVKPNIFVSGNEAKWAAARAFYAAKAIDFVIITESQLGPIPADIEGQQAIEERKARAARLRRERVALRATTETTEDRSERRRKWAAKARRLRSTETPEKRAARLKKMRSYPRRGYPNETPTQRAHRKKRHAAYERARRRKKRSLATGGQLSLGDLLTTQG